ncbi:MAG: right-handed parallel beta-helix repeat-containing protein [Prevotella sp.]|jgi:hypothetical protein
MKVKHLLFMMVMALGLVTSCSDDDSFSSSSSRLLTFSTDTVKIDTVFSNVPSTTRSLWVFNHSGDGLRCQSVRLERGAESGFRVNVDGVYLGEAQNYATHDVEVRNKDSIRVFVELTSPVNNQETPQLNEDNLIFTLESGVEQRVNLKAYAWDATLWKNVRIERDSTISSPDRPIVIYGGITVDSAATLNIAAGTTLYFHNDAGINVYGRLKCNGTAEQSVVLRGDRIDRMFDYLPYDFVPGQWQGVHFYHSSKQNELEFTDIHSTYHGVVVDSTDVTEQKLTLRNVTIHNCQGYGLMTNNAKVDLYNTQITNTLNDCVLVNGGDVTMNNCTLAQFYPFDSNRGVALRFTSKHPLERLKVDNTLITGYADDQLMGERTDSTTAFNFDFAHSMMRTPKVETADSVHFVDVVFENIKDTVSSGEKHFVRIDTENLRYNFRLDSISSAIGKADAKTAQPNDRDGRMRDDHPDIGAFEYIKP